MTQKEIIKNLLRIQEGIECDNFTRGNISELIEGIHNLQFTQGEIVQELIKIERQIESDRFTKENVYSLIRLLGKRR